MECVYWVLVSGYQEDEKKSTIEVQSSKRKRWPAEVKIKSMYEEIIETASDTVKGWRGRCVVFIQNSKVVPVRLDHAHRQGDRTTRLYGMRYLGRRWRMRGCDLLGPDGN